MDMNAYQKKARTLNHCPMEFQHFHAALGLAGEVGEVLEKIKKLYRDKKGRVDKEFKDALKKELGDVLWYVADIASNYELEMNDIGHGNIAKLEDRVRRGTIFGSGDNR